MMAGKGLTKKQILEIYANDEPGAALIRRHGIQITQNTPDSFAPYGLQEKAFSLRPATQSQTPAPIAAPAVPPASAFRQPILDAAKQTASLARQQVTQRQAQMNILRQGIKDITAIGVGVNEARLASFENKFSPYVEKNASKRQALEKQLQAYAQDEAKRREQFLEEFRAKNVTASAPAQTSGRTFASHRDRSNVRTVTTKASQGRGVSHMRVNPYSAESLYARKREAEYQDLLKQYAGLNEQALRKQMFSDEYEKTATPAPEGDIWSYTGTIRAAAKNGYINKREGEYLKLKGLVESSRTSVDDLLRQKEAYTPEQMETAKRILAQRDKAQPVSGDSNARAVQMSRMLPKERAEFMKTEELRARVNPLTAAARSAYDTATLGLGWGNSLKTESLEENARAAEEQGNAALADAYRTIAQGREGVNVLERDAAQHPFAYTAGSFVGSAVTYGPITKLVNRIPLTGKVAAAAGEKITAATGGRISAQVATNLVAGRIGDLPVDIYNAAKDTIENGDNFYDFAKRLAGDQAAGLLMDGSLEALSAGYRMIKQRLGKGADVKMMVPEEDLELVRAATNQEIPRDHIATYKPLSKDYKKDYESVALMNPVASISGEEFKKGEVDLITQVSNYFDSLGGKVVNPELGTIDIDRRGVKDSIAHGIGRKKAAAFTAVPEVLENGKIIDYQQNWKGRRYDTYVIAAPVNIADERHYMGAIVIKDDRNHYYLHEVLTTKGSPTSFKTGKVPANSKPLNPGDAELPSIMSLLEDFKNVNPPDALDSLKNSGNAKGFISGGGGIDGNHFADAGKMSAKQANDLAGQQFAQAAIDGMKKGGLEQRAAREANNQAGKRFAEAIAEGAETGAKQREAFARGLSIHKDGSITPDIVRTLEAPEQTSNALLDNYNKRYRLSNQLEHAKKELGLPEDVIEKAWHPATGEFIEKYLPEGVDPEKVRNYQQINAQLQETNNVIRGYDAQRRQTLLEQMESLIESSDSWEDKKVGFLYSRETPERNIRDIVGKDNQEEAERIIQEIYDPIHKNEAAKTRFVKYFNDKLNGFGPVSKKQREYIQKLGEGLISKADIPFKFDRDKIERVMVTMRDEIFPELLKFENQVRVLNGYPPVGKINNYFPHFLESETMWSKLAAKFGKGDGTPRAKNALPTEIAGITENRRPGTPFSAHDLKRKGTVTVYDAFEGFQGYIEGVADKIYHTDDIQRLRMFETAIRTKYSEPGVRKRVIEVLHSKLPEDEIAQKVQDILQNGNTDKMPKLVTNLRDYTNTLAGKKSLADREWEHEMGREIYTLTKKFEGRVAANMVGGNLASATTNFIPVVQSNIKKKNIIRGMGCAIARDADDFVSLHSTFLTNRVGAGKLVTKKLDTVSDALGKPMEMVDMFTSRTVVYGKYFDNLDKGMKPQAALDAADKYAASLMADRSKGALPTQFNKTNPFAKTLNMFQVEVNNQLSYFFKDLPREERKHKIAGLCGSIASIAVGSYLFNDVYEKIVGRRPAFDPIDYINEAVGDSTGYQLPNTVDAAINLATGNPLALENKEKPSAYKAGVGLAKNVAENMPFVGGLMGGGRVPVSSALPDVNGLWKNIAGSASGDIPTNKSIDGIVKSLSPMFYNTVLPFGGGQLKKTVEGVQAVKDRGVYSIDNKGRKQLDYAVKPDPWNAARAGLFGRYATDEGHAFAEGGFKPALSANETQVLMELKKEGVEQNTILDILQQIRKVPSDLPKSGLKIAQGLQSAATLSPALSENQAQTLNDWTSGAQDKKERVRRTILNASGLSEQQKLKLDMLLYPDKNEDRRGDYSSAAAFEKSQLDAKDKKLWSYKSVRNTVVDVQTFRKVTQAVKGISGEVDEYGNAVSGTARQNKVQAIAEALQVSRQKADSIYTELYQAKHTLKDFSSDIQRKYENVFKKQGISKDKFVQYMRTIDGVKSDSSQDTNENRVAALVRSGVNRRTAENFVNDMYVKIHSIDELDDKQMEQLTKLKAKADIPDEAFLKGINAAAAVSGDKDRNGKTVSGSLKMNRYTSLRKLGWNHAAAKVFLMEVYGYKDKDWT